MYFVSSAWNPSPTSNPTAPAAEEKGRDVPPKCRKFGPPLSLAAPTGVKQQTENVAGPSGRSRRTGTGIVFHHAISPR